jgi:hypothetical protein
VSGWACCMLTNQSRTFIVVTRCARDQEDHLRIVASHGRTRALACLIILSLLYGVAELVPGRFMTTDEVFYKAAGRNWAMTGRFAAPEIIGRLMKGPSLGEVYFPQPPLYTFLFGLYTKLVGFGPRRCMLYDVLVHLLLVWSMVAAAAWVFNLPRGLSVLCGALSIPLGTVGRSDELGIVFALWAAVAFQSMRPKHWRAAVGGALLGMCCATSLSAFVFLGSLTAWELVSLKQDNGHKLRQFFVAAVAGLAAAACCVTPILINHPTAYQQIFAHSADQPGIWNFVGHGVKVRAFFQLWEEALWYGFEYGILVFGLLGFAAVCWVFDRFRSRVEYLRVFLCAVAVSCIAVLTPGKYFYWWFPGVWLLITCVALAAQTSQSISQWRRRFLFAFGACVWLAASMSYFRQKAIMWTLPADQSLTVNMSRVRAEIPVGVGVMTTDYWWALAGRDRVYDTLFSNPRVSDVDYIVLSGNGSGKPGTPLKIRSRYENADFQAIYDHLNSTPESLFGLRISRSSYGFGAYILRRRGDPRALHTCSTD